MDAFLDTPNKHYLLSCSLDLLRVAVKFLKEFVCVCVCFTKRNITDFNVTEEGHQFTENKTKPVCQK